MAHCPFCASEVDEVLVQHGGTCPKCFAEIPGEEALTDPGEEVKAKQDAADQRARRMRLLPILLIAALGFVGVTGTAAFLALRPPPEVMAVVDFDAYAGWDELEDAEWVEAAPEVASAEPVATTRKGSTGPKAPLDLKNATVAPTTVDPLAGIGDVAAGPTASATSRGTRGSTATGDLGGIETPAALSGSASTSSLGSLGSLGTAGGVQRRSIPNITLTDDNEIINMAGRVMRTEIRGLQSCYSQRLKSREDLSGRWVVNLTIGKDGVPKGVSIDASDMQDAELESCMVEKVAKWRFQPIAKELPVKKSVRFQPS